MIVEAILNVFNTVFTTLFSVFPSLPAMPVMISDGFDWLLDFTSDATGLLVYLLSPPLYVVLIGLILFMTLFEYIYHFAIRFLIFRVFMGFVGR